MLKFVTSVETISPECAGFLHKLGHTSVACVLGLMPQVNKRDSDAFNDVILFTVTSLRH